MTKQLIVEAPDGTQQLITVDATGCYYDQSKVTWDTSIDGALPADLSGLGGLVKQGNSLVVDATKKAAFDAAQAAKQAAANAAQQAKANRKSLFKDLSKITDPNVKQLLKAIIDEFNLG